MFFFYIELYVENECRRYRILRGLYYYYYYSFETVLFVGITYVQDKRRI